MKNAIVTGGTKGIGLATARMLLKEGYHVTVTYSGDSEAALRCRNELKDISSHSEIIKCDQSNKEDMRRLVELMKNKGNVDCIVCNAGVSLRRQFTEITDEEWERAMHINVNSNVFLIRDLYERFVACNHGIFTFYHGISVLFISHTFHDHLRLYAVWHFHYNRLAVDHVVFRTVVYTSAIA